MDCELFKRRGSRSIGLSPGQNWDHHPQRELWQTGTASLMMWWCGHSTKCQLLQGTSRHPLEEPPIYFQMYFTLDAISRMQWKLQNAGQVYDLLCHRHSSSWNLQDNTWSFSCGKGFGCAHRQPTKGFKDHFAGITFMANCMLGIIWKTFDYPEEDTFITLYKSFVWPILEYGHSLWQPH